jgi:hypothetical protein
VKSLITFVSVLGSVLILWGCSRAPSEGRSESSRLFSRDTALHCATSGAGGQCILWDPSLILLIARPELYDQKRVQVVGFVNFEFEGNGLYVSRGDWENNNTKNGLWIDPPGESIGVTSTNLPNQRFILVEGTFRADRRGHMDLWSGAIEYVTRLEPWGRTPTVQDSIPFR